MKYKNRASTKNITKAAKCEKESATSVKPNCSVGTDAAKGCALLRCVKTSGSRRVWRLEANYKPGLLALDEMPPRV